MGFMLILVTRLLFYRILEAAKRSYCYYGSLKLRADGGSVGKTIARACRQPNLGLQLASLGW